MHLLALPFTRSATPPYVHLTSFYVGVLPVLAVIGMRLSGFNLNAHRSETEQNGAAAQSLVLIHIVHSGFEPFISRFPTVKYFIIPNSWSVI